VIRSMTGFGRGEVPLGGGLLAAEVKTVNGRHLEVRLRLPREFSAFEQPLRELAASFFERGQVEVLVRLPPEGVGEPRVEVDLQAARAYAEGGALLSSELGLGDALPLATLLTLPGVVRTLEPELDGSEVEGALRAAVEAGSSAAVEMRVREGQNLERELRRRLEGLGAAVEAIGLRAEDVKRGLRERLTKRVAALAPELELDPARLEQEVVLYADRMDVTEETVRLGSHLEQFHETLGESGPVGRKLEFLLQELGREVNTIGSKVSDAGITHRVVEMKTELEKLREQVMNVE
jgi:uncharacterized protein (TIGR00255 family)